jgi:hypothetical protein
MLLAIVHSRLWIVVLKTWNLRAKLPISQRQLAFCLEKNHDQNSCAKNGLASHPWDNINPAGRDSCPDPSAVVRCSTVVLRLTSNLVNVIKKSRISVSYRMSKI